ncbi:arsenate reductase ArsC [Variovorax paradoxus]|uniref:arsenate reductase ArsC n=1 Tax=Variovorax paradoxus TaxID=34073 RepID=UPI0021ACA1CB|nr:arsenate reductase ArsC [Variovorax paradoxus]UVH57821.1 arsenate reductase ArsC [Variovorax paradoxus]
MTSSHVTHVLFICNSNAARSLIAEVLLNQLGGGRFHAYSAGSTPTPDGKPDPRTLEALAGAGFPTDGLRSKSWSEFGLPGAPQMDLIVTLCDEAAGETCPVWPGRPATSHWSHPDPRAEEAARNPEAFVHTMLAIRRHVDLLVALPDERIDRLVLGAEAARIGERQAA